MKGNAMRIIGSRQLLTCLVTACFAGAALAANCFVQNENEKVCYEDQGTNPGQTFTTTRLCPNPAGPDANPPFVIRTVTVKVLGQWTKPQVRSPKTGEIGMTTKQVKGLCHGRGQIQDCNIPPGFEPPADLANPNDPGEGPCTGSGCIACSKG